jgi:cytochrome c oxidase cbb3-type subunit III
VKRAIEFLSALLGSALMLYGQAAKPAIQTPNVKREQAAKNASKQIYSPEQIKIGEDLFVQKCAFCHGRDAGGGETGPDLTRSKLVADDVKGNLISEVVRNGRPEKGMPRFTSSENEMTGLVAFIHDQKTKAESQQGGRKGVDPADLQTGNAEAGKKYFNNEGGCSSCHSPTGDLAGVASRFQGLQLEERLLYPKRARAHATVTLSSGETITGILAYRDEFVIAIRDDSGWYRSWSINSVKYKIDAPAEAHAELLAKYTDENIHDLMAYLQMLK